MSLLDRVQVLHRTECTRPRADAVMVWLAGALLAAVVLTAVVHWGLRHAGAPAGLRLATQIAGSLVLLTVALGLPALAVPGRGLRAWALAAVPALLLVPWAFFSFAIAGPVPPTLAALPPVLPAALAGLALLAAIGGIVAAARPEADAGAAPAPEAAPVRQAGHVPVAAAALAAGLAVLTIAGEPLSAPLAAWSVLTGEAFAALAGFAVLRRLLAAGGPPPEARVPGVLPVRLAAPGRGLGRWLGGPAVPEGAPPADAPPGAAFGRALALTAVPHPFVVAAAIVLGAPLTATLIAALVPAALLLALTAVTGLPGRARGWSGEGLGAVVILAGVLFIVVRGVGTPFQAAGLGALAAAAMIVVSAGPAAASRLGPALRSAVGDVALLGVVVTAAAVLAVACGAAGNAAGLGRAAAPEVAAPPAVAALVAVLAVLRRRLDPAACLIVIAVPVLVMVWTLAMPPTVAAVVLCLGMAAAEALPQAPRGRFPVPAVVVAALAVAVAAEPALVLWLPDSLPFHLGW